MQINPDLKKLSAWWSRLVSSQGNATWVILVTTNTRRRSRKILFEQEEQIEKDTIAARGGQEDICRNIFSVSICHHSDLFIS